MDFIGKKWHLVSLNTIHVADSLLYIMCLSSSEWAIFPLDIIVPPALYTKVSPVNVVLSTKITVALLGHLTASACLYGWP